MTKEELIKKHLEGWTGLQKASIEHFAQTGKASGSFFIALKAMLDEHAENVVTNLLQSCVSGQLPLRECSDCGTKFKSHGRCPECNPMG